MATKLFSSFLGYATVDILQQVNFTETRIDYHHLQATTDLHNYSMNMNAMSDLERENALLRAQVQEKEDAIRLSHSGREIIEVGFRLFHH